MTDDFNVYSGLSKEFASHDVIRHKNANFSRREGSKTISTNTVEGYFSLVKRGITGVYHHVGRQHLHRYLSEFDFRYNSRKEKDGDRTLMALKGSNGKRLMLWDSKQP